MSKPRPDNVYEFFLKIPPSEILPGETAPDHYTLLGLPHFSDDAAALKEASVARNTEMLRWQTSDYYHWSKEPWGEVVAAILTLENSDKKAAYDAGLRQRLGLPEAQPVVQHPDNVYDFFLKIPPRTLLPVEQVHIVQTTQDNASEVRFRIWAGDSKNRDQCKELGFCVVGPLPDRMPSGSKFEIQIQFEKDGRIKVMTRCLTTKIEVRAVIDGKDLLTQEQVERDGKGLLTQEQVERERRDLVRRQFN